MISTRFLAAAIAILAMAACTPMPAAPAATPIPAPELGQAEAALTRYFATLSAARYSEAASLYSGPTASLQANNPDVNPDDLPTLLERYCTRNGGVCLPIGRVLQREAASADTFVFVVEFENPDGSTFEIGPCCGEEDTGQRTREFAYTVLILEGEYLVFKLPPYVP